MTIKRLSWMTAGLLVAAAAVLAVLALQTPASSQPAADEAAGSAASKSSLARQLARYGKPQVFVIVVDGLDGDKYDDGSLPFFRSLVRQRGTYYKESRSIMVAETNPNHTAMLTGAYGGKSGIPGNAYALYAAAGESSVNGCPVNGTGPGPHEALLDPACVRAQTIFQATAGASSGEPITTAGIFGKPKLGTLYAARRNGGAYAADYLWAPCPPSGKRPDYCADVPTPTFGYADDATTMDAVLAAARDGVAGEDGQRRAPGYTFVNLPQVDYTGHENGRGREYDQAVANAQVQLRRLVSQQQQLGRWNRTVLIVTSDHSMGSTPGQISLTELFVKAGIPADRFLVTGNGSLDMVYLTDRSAADRDQLLKRMRTIALGASNGEASVDEALYRLPNAADGGARFTLKRVHPQWRMDEPLVGDLVVTQKPGGRFAEPINPLAGNHGSPFTTDNFTMVTGGWKGLARNGTLKGKVGKRFDDTARNPGQAENVDLAPTATALLGLGLPRDNQGRVLREAFVRVGGSRNR
ncbi:MAG: alkaline phosphatase family protein [Solirubrobacterales bacterium]